MLPNPDQKILFKLRELRSAPNPNQLNIDSLVDELTPQARAIYKEGEFNAQRVHQYIELRQPSTALVAQSPTHIDVNNQSIPVVEYQGEPVVTFAMVDTVHERPAGTAKDRFNRNRDRFVPQEDFHLIDYSKKYEFHTFGIEVPTRGLTILTETGYLMLTKSLTDDLAWRVQRELVKGYFRSKSVAVPHNPIGKLRLAADLTQQAIAAMQDAA